MLSRLRRQMSCLPYGAKPNAVLEEPSDDGTSTKKSCAASNASHGASTRIGRGSDCSPWTSAGDNALLKDMKGSSHVDVPCSVAEFEELERYPSVAKEPRTLCTDSSQHPSRNTTAHCSHQGASNVNEAAGLQGRARHSLDGQTRTGSEPDDETTRRLAQQIEEWGREQNGPDIVSIAKAYVGIQKMAEEEALKHRFNMIKHDAIRLRPEAAHLFLSLQRDDFEDLDDTPLPRHCTK